MKTGRPRKPRELHLVDGTYRSDRQARATPKPAVAMPTPPSFLSADALREWRRVSRELHTLGLLTRIDRAALAAYCQSYGRWVAAERALAKMAERDEATGALIVRTANGGAMANPLVYIAHSAMRLCMRFAVEFGMSPASRSGIDLSKDAGPEGGGPASKYF